MQIVTHTTTLINSQSSLPVVELTDKALVKAPGKSIIKKKYGKHGPLYKLNGKLDTPLAFTTFELYHAIAKADLLLVATAAELDDHAKRVWCRYFDLFDWTTGNLCLGTNMARFYKSHSALAGSVGEGTTLLFMHGKEYPYWDHAELLLSRAASRGSLPGAVPVASSLQPVGLIHPPMPLAKPLGSKSKKAKKGENRHADFICENTKSEYALAEAKCSFVGSADPPIKGNLSSAVVQLEKLQARFGLTPKASFAVGTYLREASNCALQPSLIVFTDPVVPNAPLDDFPSDWIRRGNYGSWLIGMGFFAAGIALRERRGVKLLPVCLPIVEIGGNEFAFVIHSASGPNQRLWHDPWIFSHCDQLPSFDLSMLWNAYFRDGPVDELFVYGLEIAALKSASVAAQNGENRELLQVGGIEPQTQRFANEWFAGSILRDGTLFGSIRLNKIKSVTIRFQKFELLAVADGSHAVVVTKPKIARTPSSKKKPLNLIIDDDW